MMHRAVDSVARDGIGCTSGLEFGLNAAAQGMCREMMDAILKSEAATGCDREHGPCERNGGTHTKDIVTLFGRVDNVPRTYFWRKPADGEIDAGRGHFPFDEKLGLLGRYTPALVEEVLRLGAIHTYEEASIEFGKAHGFELSPDAIRDIVIGCQGEICEFNEGCAGSDTEHRARLAYVLADGTGISMLGKYLEGIKGKNGDAKTREVKLAAFFTGSMKRGKPFRDEDSTTYVATTKRWEDFGRMARREYDRRFPLCPETTIFLSDGGKWLRSVHDNFFPFATMILDLYHALEHLRGIMKLLGMDDKSDKWKGQFRKWKRMFKTGRVKSVIAEIESLAKDAGKETDVDKQLQYYRDNLDRMEYDKYVQNGWFIGSGVVESGCKCVVQQRLKLSGMHWSVDGAEALLPIRALYKSGRLDEFHNWRVRNLRQVAYSSAA